MHSCQGSELKEISTVLTPERGAQATPAIALIPALILPSLGTSILEAIFMGAFLDQPRGIQYPLFPSHVQISILLIHLTAETYPYKPATTKRAGNP